MIFVECKVDYALVAALGAPAREIEHAYDKGRVCKRLQEANGSRGLVDEDPLSSQPSYIESLKLAGREHDVSVLKDAQRNNKLIVLCPRLEEWLLRAAEESGVDAEVHGIPRRASKAHRALALDQRAIPRLLQALSGRSPRIDALKKCLLGGGA